MPALLSLHDPPPLRREPAPSPRPLQATPPTQLHLCGCTLRSILTHRAQRAGSHTGDRRKGPDGRKKGRGCKRPHPHSHSRTLPTLTLQTIFLVASTLWVSSSTLRYAITWSVRSQGRFAFRCCGFRGCNSYWCRFACCKCSRSYRPTLLDGVGEEGGRGAVLGWFLVRFFRGTPL